jgi:hypothetical protein
MFNGITLTENLWRRFAIWLINRLKMPQSVGAALQSDRKPVR